IENRHCKALTARTRIGNEEILLAKPETYMNLSGLSVLELVRKYEVDPEQGVLVIYDELDLPLGMIRVRARGSSAGHDGMQSIINALQTEEIARIRIGIAPLPIHAKTGREWGPGNDPRKGGARYILAPFRKSMLAPVDEALDLAAQAVHVIVTEGIAPAMNRF